MDVNYCALAISILCGCSPEQAFDLYYDGVKRPVSKAEKKEETEDMIAMKAHGMTAVQIADVFGMQWRTVCKRIERENRRINARG